MVGALPSFVLNLVFLMFFRRIPRKSWYEKTVERVFRDRKLCVEKLLSFGFVRVESGFLRRAALLDGQLCMELEIHADGSVHATVHDADGKNIRHADPGTEDRLRTRMLRREYEEELWHVAECCFEPDFSRRLPPGASSRTSVKLTGRNWNSCGGSFRGTQWCGGRIRKMVRRFSGCAALEAGGQFQGTGGGFEPAGLSR